MKLYHLAKISQKPTLQYLCNCRNACSVFGIDANELSYITGFDTSYPDSHNPDIVTKLDSNNPFFQVPKRHLNENILIFKNEAHGLIIIYDVDSDIHYYYSL
jgi:hypothetical protein